MSRSKALNRREFLKLSLVASGGAMLVACGPTSTPAPATQAPTPVAEATKEIATEVAPAKEPVTIRVSVWGDVPDKNINDRAAAAFADVRSDIKVAPETYVGEYYDKVKVNFAGGNSADVVYMEGYQWQPFADVVVPLDEYIKADDMSRAWPDVPNYQYLTTWHGHTYLSVIDTGSIVMLYSKTLFDKAGVPYPTDNWTFNDFKEMVAKLTREEGGVKYYGYAMCGGAWLGGYVWWIPWLRMDGKTEFDTIVEPKKAQWNQPEIVQALQFENYDVIDKGYAPSPSTIQGGGISVATGRVAMGLQGPWYLPQCYGPQAVNEGGIQFDVVVPPTGALGKPTPDAEIQGHMLSSQSKHQAEAWAVMKFWMGEEVAKITAEEGRMCGTPENTDKYWVPIATEKYHFKNASAFVKAQLNGYCPMVGGAGANYTAMTGAGGPLAKAADAMWGLQKPAQQAMEEANVEIQKLLDDYWTKKTG